MRKGILLLATVALLFTSCANKTTDESKSNGVDTTELKAKISEPLKIGEEPNISSHWSYYTDVNEMTDSTSENAVIGPIDMVREGSYPYRPIALLLYVRFDDRYGNEVILATTSYATFDLAQLESCEVEMRFDDEPVEYITFVPSYPYSPHVMFAVEAQPIVDKLLTHDKLRIRANLYDMESKVFHYDIGGFKWNYGRVL